jgi:2-polyprenyl-3-methyl-5-hydroxy-6-metoxy-1,4-benzoquinol methylase
MDQQVHWNNIAGKYDDEVFDVFKSDKNQVLTRYFRKHSDNKKTATDFGCGIGKAFEYLSPSFKSVLALDISEECISIAKTRGYQNITYKRADLTRSNVKLEPADFGLCCNVAILPEPERNKAILKTVARGLNKGGTALIVVPSMESILYSSWRLVEWYKKEGVEPHQVPSHELNYYDVNTTDIIQGVIKINGVPTKHYSNAELQVIFREAGLKITAIEKLEYGWETEFDSPPSWLKDPYPWDWMIECAK